MIASGGPIVSLGSAGSFGLLGGTISNTGASVVTGNVGATTTVTGFPPGIATGTVYPAPSNPAVNQAYLDFESAFNSAAGLTSAGSFTTATSQTFLGNTVYASAGDISTITGTSLTFNALNNPNAVFIIQIPGAFTVNGAMTFTLENEAQASNIFWIVKNAATISVGSSGAILFDGNILTGSSFTMSAASGGSGVLAGTIDGCVFAETANTLAGMTNVGGCASSSANSVPEPGGAWLVGLGCMLGIAGWRRFRSVSRGL